MSHSPSSPGFGSDVPQQTFGVGDTTGGMREAYIVSRLPSGKPSRDNLGWLALIKNNLAVNYIIAC